MRKEYITPKGVSLSPNFSEAVKVGNTIYLAGKVGRDEQGRIVEGGFEAQAIQTFENIKLILEAAGASLRDVVKVTVYLANIDDSKKFQEVRARYFELPRPASTVVEVSRLSPGAVVEIEAIAVVD